jgi:FkbM family methyltransferase
MIAVELQSRFGNQMFQYAFALAAAQRLETDFVVCGSSWVGLEREELSECFQLGGHGLPFVDDPPYPVVRIGHQDWNTPEDVLADLTDWTRYSGFFQSDRFFAGAEADVRSAFEPSSENAEVFRERYTDLLARPYVCCHVRHTDYETFAGGVALPLEYYRDALRLVAPAPGTPIVFVGDDLDVAHAAFEDLDGVRFEHNEPIIDLQLLVHASTAVTSNSTFAWWGAWLGDRSKHVVAPKHWINWTHRSGWQRAAQDTERTKRGWEYPRAIIPPAWSQVPVRRPWRDRLAPWSLKSSAILAANNARTPFRARTSSGGAIARDARATPAAEHPAEVRKTGARARLNAFARKARAERFRRGERRRRIRFYRELIGRGELCFDVGANVGDRTELFLAVPARVVAIEPQASCHRTLEDRYGREPRVKLVRAAVGSAPGEAELRKTRAGTVYASLSSEWIDRTRASGRFSSFDWDETERVTVTTLDALIDAHGAPTFCKIDVEGYERSVLEGLSRPIQALSIEFAPEFLDSTAACITRLEELAAYEFNYSLNETLEFARDWWMRPAELLAALEPLRDNATVFGDVYARLR